MNRRCCPAAAMGAPRLAASIAVLLAISTPATAQTVSPADAHYREAVRFYKAGRYQDALALFLKAKAERTSLKIEFNIGVTREALGQLPEAAEQFELTKRLAANANDAPSIALAEQRLEALRGSLGCLSVRSPVAGVKILVDGALRGTTPLATSLYLRPGVHRLVAEQQGAPPYSLELHVVAGEIKRIALPAPSTPTTRPAVRAAIPAPRAVAPAPTLPDEQIAQQQEQQMHARRQKTRWGYAALGTASALLATSAVLFGVGASAGNRAKADYDQGSQDNDGDAMLTARDRVEAARSTIIVADVLAGLGAATLGVSLYLLLTRPEAIPRGRGAAIRSALKPSASIWASPSGLGVSGSF